MSKEEIPQYFYKVDGCPAQTAHDADCVCWHDEGSGPFPDERPDDPDTLKEWRFKPHNGPHERAAGGGPLDAVAGAHGTTEE